MKVQTQQLRKDLETLKKAESFMNRKVECKYYIMVCLAIQQIDIEIERRDEMRKKNIAFLQSM